MKRALFPALLLLTACGGEDLCINEYVASNATGLTDEAGAFPDWIELANVGPADVDLADYSLTDDLALPHKQRLPSVVLPAGGHLVFFADRDLQEGPLHLGFKLRKAGEQIGLFDPDGVEVDALSYEAQTTDVSAARVSDCASEWFFDDTPSPGQSND